MTAQQRRPPVIPEALAAIRYAHEWLETVEERATGYFGLDHRLGENDNACTLCHAAAALEGRVEPIEDPGPMDTEV